MVNGKETQSCIPMDSQDGLYSAFDGQSLSLLCVSSAIQHAAHSLPQNLEQRLCSECDIEVAQPDTGVVLAIAGDATFLQRLDSDVGLVENMVLEYFEIREILPAIANLAKLRTTYIRNKACLVLERSL